MLTVNLEGENMGNHRTILSAFLFKMFIINFLKKYRIWAVDINRLAHIFFKVGKWSWGNLETTV